jgi:hypothetical protein
MKTTIILLSLVINLIFYYSCDSSGDTIHIDQETKDYCLYKQGSYWVYQDSASLETDSIVITTSPYFTSSKGGGTTDDCEVYSFNVEIFLNDTVESFYSRIRPGMDAEFDSQKPIWFFMNSAVSSINYYMYYTYHNGNLGSSYNSFIYTHNDFNSKFESFLGNCNLNNVDYGDVKVFLLSYESSTEETFMKLYWAKHIGLIRIEDYSDSTDLVVKNLLRYNVENY